MGHSSWWEWAIRGGFLALLAAIAGIAVYSASRERWQLELEHEIAAPPAAVFAFLTETERRIAWEPNLLDLAPLTGEPGEMGATRLLFMGAGGRRWQVEERLETVAPPARWMVTRDGPDTERTIAVRLAARQDGGTRLEWREEMRFKGLENRLMGLVTVRERRATLAQALARLGRLAEAARQQ